ncbi:hypothetical protein BBOV_III002860 [Babesia bovis T2Bo]|uniref:Uncharacterized protein n=1 Tax=Babesia bovis TaxID=5865 RepID=S6BDG9_BABBO|nr:hypothetical protein BBOV_III002860 [Babesia bovis T2Bo]EDO07850.2 hypothetical protein BBOV_III002860 [Babesia bovis T2Bo]BAN64159.1 conserved hypothetical protein [Babesia bovis]
MYHVLVTWLLLTHICLAKVKNDKQKQETQVMSTCGEGLKGLLDHKFDNHDEEARLTTAAYLSKNMLRLYTGNTTYLTIDLNEAVLPIETLGEKCFSIRSHNALPNVLCASGLLERNKWINAIEASMLCAETGIKSMLPLIPGEETLEEIDEEKPTGINLFIHDGPVGRPQIYINGKTIEELENERNKESLDSAHVENDMSALGDLDQLFPTFDTNDRDQVEVAPVDPEALAEARAEAGMVDDTTPEMGYYKQEREL